MRLVAKVGDGDKALGICVNAWIVSFEFWKNGKKPIPGKAWLERCLSDALIETGLARVVEDGAIYVCGSERMHAWYHKLVEAGRKGGLKSQEKKSSKAQALSSKRKQKQPSYSYSSSYSYTDTCTDTVSEGGAEAPAPRSKGSVPNPLNGITWSAYSEGYRSRYGTDPVRNATVNGQIAQLVKRLGSEAPLVVEFYLSQNRAFYLQSCHPIGLCLKDAEALRTQWANNNHALPTQARHVERQSANMAAFIEANEILKAREIKNGKQ